MLRLLLYVTETMMAILLMVICCEGIHMAIRALHGSCKASKL